MKNKILLQLATVVAITTMSMADTVTDQQSIWKFLDFSLKEASGKSIKLQSVEYGEITEINGSDWKAYQTNIKLDTPEGAVEVPRTFFTNGNLIASDIYSPELNQTYSTLLQPIISNDEYTENRHVVGNINAKHKVLVFSDPFCPFCVQVFPRLLELVKNNPDELSLYLVHTPLTHLHPASVYLEQALIVAKEKGNNDALARVYSTEFNPHHTEEGILADLSKKLDINITKEEMRQPKILRTVLAEKETVSKYGVKGTPTIYLDGKKINDLSKIVEISETKK